MKMKFAAINRDTNAIKDLFDSAYEAYNAMTEYMAEDRKNNTICFRGYGVKMLILDENDNVVIGGVS